MKNIIIILSVLLLFGTLLFLSLALYAQNIGEKSGNTNGNLGNKGYLAQSSGGQRRRRARGIYEGAAYV